MHPPRIRSAPAGRTKSKKASATKDIEEWVLSGKEQETDSSRIRSGQLTENITEERLLRSRLMEMGKERFKILSKCDHEIQSFKDRQKRKGFRVKLPRPMSANNAFDRRSSLSERSYISRTNESTVAPMVLITPGMRGKNVQFDLEPTKTECCKAHAHERLSYPRPRTVPAKKSRQLQEPILEEWQPLTMTNDWSRPSTASGVAHNPRSAPSVSVLTNDYLKNMPNKHEDFTVITTEPRFTALESSLSNNYTIDCKVGVRRIIENITSLSLPMRTGSKEAKRELESKIALFMQQNNIVF